MRIGIMLRALDEKGGIGIYTRNITEELLVRDQENEYVLFYRNKDNIGRFAKYSQVTERYLAASSKVIWDQVSIPLACREENVDVLFHPKFTVPILAPCKTVMVLHGAGWFMPEFQHFWNKNDLRYVRLMMPVYCRRAAAVLSVSNITTDTFNRVFNLPQGRIKTVYFAPGKIFERVTDEETLQAVREKYQLPDEFIFTLSGYDRGNRKNISGIFGAYKILYPKISHSLVIGGRNCEQFKVDYRLDESEYGKGIHFLGWIEQADLPAIYSLADLFLYPSHVEAFPIPITEALACGTPIVTSQANGLVEIVGDAAILVDPGNAKQIAEGVSSVLSDPELRFNLSQRALVRAKRYSWDKCAQETLEILHSVVPSSS
jgi:glycosyltransferase involved in cell wall biosynthesis